jgi:cation-transporting P-type ATPase E
MDGLTSDQVAEKIKQGKVNHAPRQNSDSIGKIILKNTLTLFNLVNLILALMIISVGAYKNLLFILVAVANTLISIINEVRAKKTIDKMRLLSEKTPTVIRNGKPQQIPQSQIVEGDLLIFSIGDQIIVDAKILEGGIEVNESFVTGEQNNIKKQSGDQLISGSFIVSGTCKAVATSVGADNFINKLESSARNIKSSKSQLFQIMNNIVKYLSYTLIPIGILLLISRLNVSATPKIAVTSTVAALISMIPEGLILLTSSVLALATIRLSKKQVLVQDLYSTETLARVDCIALDKTGTLTTGKMTVRGIILPNSTEITDLSTKSPAKTALINTLELILSHTQADNATSTALKQTFLKTTKNRATTLILEEIPFSSDRKYSGVKLKNQEVLMGAPKFLLSDESQLKIAAKFAKDYRVLAVVEKSQTVKFLGFVLLEDQIRQDAPEIINYFYDNDIDVKIISGDDLTTVTTIAECVGVKDLRGIDLSTAAHKNYSELVKNYSIFTRVKPVEKKSLILALKKQNYTVAMTGDGVNDILAMKEADCSIAIGEGSDAARRAAKIVLMNSNFSSVPSIIDEGRQSINNLERSATLFLSKTTYAVILAVLFVLIPIKYPFIPIEMSLLNFVCIGFPGVILALETNTSRIKNQFLSNVKKYSIPIGIAISIAILVFSIIATNLNLTQSQMSLISAIIVFVIDFFLIYRISRPLNKFRALLLGVILTIFILAISIPLTRIFFFG